MLREARLYEQCCFLVPSHPLRKQVLVVLVVIAVVVLHIAVVVAIVLAITVIILIICRDTGLLQSS